MAVRAERDGGDQGEAGQAGGLADHRQVAGHRERRADVGVGHPEVERDGGGLEREADQGEHRAGLGERLQLGGGVREALGDALELDRPGGGVDEADAEQHHGGRGDGGEEELERALRAPAVPAQRDQGERGQGGDLQGDHQGGEVAGGGQQGGAAGGGEQQEPVLAAGQLLGVHGVQREQHREQRAAEGEQLEGEREVVGGVGAAAGREAEGGAGPAQQGQQHGERGEQAGGAQPPEQALAGLGQEQVGDQHGEGGERGDQRRGDGHPVDGLDQAARVGDGERGHDGLPQVVSGGHQPLPRRCLTAGSERPSSSAGHRPATSVSAASGVQLAAS